MLCSKFQRVVVVDVHVTTWIKRACPIFFTRDLTPRKKLLRRALIFSDRSRDIFEKWIGGHNNDYARTMV